MRHDPAGRAIAGISSGGICSFTVAWERADQFSKVLSWVGSFTNIASTARNVESSTSGPIPSPGMRVIWWAMRATIAAG